MKNLIPLFAIILCCSLAHPAHARKKDRHAAKENAVLALAEPDMMATPSRPHPIVAPIEEAYRHHVNKNEHRYGIDVSRYQGKIDWQTVKTDKNVGYVYLKATEGASLVDVTYRYNLDEARKAGLKVGCYHFFSPTVAPETQFDNFSANVKLDEQDLLPIIDVETRGRCSLKQFCDKLTHPQFAKLTLCRTEGTRIAYSAPRGRQPRNTGVFHGYGTYEMKAFPRIRLQFGKA